MWGGALSTPSLDLLGPSEGLDPALPVRSCRAEGLGVLSSREFSPKAPNTTLVHDLNPGGLGVPNSFLLRSEALGSQAGTAGL